MTKEEREEIFENIISDLRTKFIHSDKKRLNAHDPVNDRLSEKYRRLPLD